MQTDTRLGTIEDVLAGVSEELAAVTLFLRDQIIAADPDTVETPRPGDRSLSYGIGPKKMIEGYAYLMPQRGYVNLGFYRGTSLPDPAGLLEGTGAALRHVKIRTLDEARRQAVRELIVAAVADRKGGRATAPD
jgi:hypothetical protein